MQYFRSNCLSVLSCSFVSYQNMKCCSCQYAACSPEGQTVLCKHNDEVLYTALSSSFTLLKLDSSQVQSRMSLRSFNHITRQRFHFVCQLKACNVRVMAGVEKFSTVKW